MSEHPKPDPNADPASKLNLSGRAPAPFIVGFALVAPVVIALIAALLKYGPAFTSHPRGVLQSDRPQAGGSRVP